MKAAGAGRLEQLASVAGAAGERGATGLRKLVEVLSDQQRQLMLLEQQIAFLETERADGEALRERLRGDHLSQMERARESLERLRGERDEMARTIRMLRENLVTLRAQEPPQPRLAHTRAVDSGLPLRNRRIAAITDEFTHGALLGSCDIQQVEIVGWREQLEAFRPELLFVESAWHGNQGQWTRKVSHPSAELHAVLDWCRENGVATAFWNKEDPVHFDTFINTARHFDHVFTTDLDCVPRYKTRLRHDRAYLLPFWGQPRRHNPVETYQRKEAFCFAGAYYVRYPERQRDFDTLIQALGSLAPVEIFDRNHGKDDPNYMFPEGYAGLIQGGLPYSDIDRAYKGYAFGLNLNSVKQSQTMFARRVFDLMLSNTHVVSNYSRGLRLLFGDLVTSTDDGTELQRKLRPFLVDGQVSYRRLHRLAALRKVMLEHSAEHRLGYVFSKVHGRLVGRGLPGVVLVSAVSNLEDMQRVVAAYDRQAWNDKRLVLVLQGNFLAAAPESTRGRGDIELVAGSDAAGLHPAHQWAGKLVAFLSPRDYYGPDYATDMALAFLYSPADVVGKNAWFESDGDGIALRGHGCQYTWQESVPVRRAMAAASALAGSSLAEWVEALDEARIRGVACLAIDEFGYVANTPAEAVPEFDLELDRGVRIDDLLEVAERSAGTPVAEQAESGLDAASLAALFTSIEAGGVRVLAGRGGLAVHSSLQQDLHRYVYSRQVIAADQLTHHARFEVALSAVPGLQMDLVMLFLDSEGNRLGQFIRKSRMSHIASLPEGTVGIRLGLRIQGPGDTMVGGLSFHAAPATEQRVAWLGRTRHLVLTNVYPSTRHLYRNAFVHRRVLGYRAAGLPVDVFALQPKAHPHAYEFENVDVVVGGTGDLAAMLDATGHESVLVHFLDEAMWSVLKERLPTTRVYVWVHGAEIQPWHRRDFNFSSDAERDAARVASDARVAFWNGVLRNPHPNLHLIFVSRYFAEEVMEDYGVKLDPGSYSIIHNVVDTDLFPYREKTPGQRLKLLSIRPYASRKYANDLTVAAICLLKDKPYFDDLEFRLVGTGPLLEETLAPLRDMPNVVIEPRFLSQSEISRLHADYGVFLVPTRMDAQGVSRDEAMSSGLVPITNRVAAIPEFMDETCGFMVEPEDPQAIADAIDALVRCPETFERMSIAAAARPRAQTSVPNTIGREILLIRGPADPSTMPKTKTESRE